MEGGDVETGAPTSRELFGNSQLVDNGVKHSSESASVSVGSCLTPWAVPCEIITRKSNHIKCFLHKNK